MGFVRNLVLFPAVKMFFENLLRTDKVNAMSLAHDFFLGGGTSVFTMQMLSAVTSMLDLHITTYC